MNRYQALLKQREDLRTAARANLDAAADGWQARDDDFQAKFTDAQDAIARWERLQADERAEGRSVAIVTDLAAEKPWAPAEARKKNPLAGFGAFMQAVAAAARPGGPVDPRLFAGPSGGSATVPSDAGYLIRTDYTTELLSRAFQGSVLAQRCRRIGIGADADSLEAIYVDETSRATGSRWGGVQVYRAAEADAVSATKPKLGRLEIRLEDLRGLAYATDRMLRDAAAMEAIYSQAFAEEFAFRVDDEIVRGTGAGQCQGLLTAPCTVSVAKETNQAAATIVHANLSKMWARCWSRSKASAVWFINQDLGPQLDELSIPAGTAALEPRFVNYNAAGILTIKGRPVVEVEQAESLGTVGDIVLADLGEYLLIDKDTLQSDASMHVRFIYHEMTFRWQYRINGMPIWKAPKTPYKGTGNTLSPFVTLATRA